MSHPFGTSNPGIGGLDELTSAEEAIIADIAALGSPGQSLVVDGAGTGVEWSTPAGGGDVASSSNFGTDNVLIRSDGTTKNVQSSGISVDDSDNMSGVNTLTVPEVTAPSTPSSGNVVIYAKSDGKLYIKDDAGTETDLTSGGSGGDAWSDPVDAVITPDADGTRDLATTGTRFATGYFDAINITNNIVVGGTVDGRDIATDGTKLDGIEANATGDQTDAEIKTAVDNELGGSTVGTTDTQTITNKTIDGDSNTISNLDIGNEVDWAVISDVADRTAFASGDKLLIFEAGVGLRKIDYDDLPSGGGGSNTLDQAYDEGGAGSGRAITADSGAVEITVSNSSNNAGLSVVQNDTTNNPNSITVSNAGTGVELDITTTNAGAAGAAIDLYHNSASPAASDTPGTITIYGEDAGGSKVVYGRIQSTITDPSTSNEDSTMEFSTADSGGEFTKLAIKADTNGIFVGDTFFGAGIVSSEGNNDLILQTGNSTTGSITITDGSNGDITLDPDGTGIVKGELKRFMVQLLADDTAQSTDTSIGGDFRISNRAITVKAVGAYVDTAGTTGTCTVDINEAGTSILSTKITIDSTEKSSETAATAPVISDSAIAADAIITFDLDAVQTTPANGLKVWIDYVYA